MAFSLLVDLLVATLLAVTIGYCVILNRKLKALRRNEEALAQVVAGLNEAAARAEAGVGHLRKAGEEVGGSLSEKMEDARALYDELTFMGERGDRVVARLDSSMTRARAVPTKATSAAAAQAAPAKATPARAASGRHAGEAPARTRAERELLETLAALR